VLVNKFDLILFDLGYIAPQAAIATAAALYVTDRADVQPAHTGLQPSSQTTTCAALVCRLMVCKPVIHVITWITTHLPTRMGWKAKLPWLVDPLLTLYP